MDSAVQLALMSKAKKVFGADDTFLSFPVSLPTYTRRKLDFYAQDDADTARQSLDNLKEFSTLVNLIPGDEAWLPTETLFLWDVYKQVLEEADFASSTRTPEEEAKYQEALAYLLVTDEGGGREDSPPMKVYRQHKDAYLLAQQTYLAAKSTAECATDQAELQRWRDVDEPTRRAELDALLAQWIIKGYRNEVEAAQSTVVSLGARSPLQTLAEWKGRFNPEIDTLTGDDDNFTVFPSPFSPCNALEEGAWKPFKLSEQEIQALLNDAPAEMRARFAADNAASPVSMTFEFSSAMILRPWFAAEAFRARFWRFADPNRIVSDGNKPPTGLCPAYVTAVVFARKVTVEGKQPEPGVSDLKPFLGFHFEIAVKNQKMLSLIRQKALIAAPMRHAEQTLTRASSAAEAPHTVAAAPIAMNIRKKNITILRTAIVDGAVAKPQIAQKISKHPPLLNFHATAFTRLTEATTLVTPIETTPTPPQTVTDEEIYILAFICKALPKCPDPDSALQW